MKDNGQEGGGGNTGSAAAWVPSHTTTRGRPGRSSRYDVIERESKQLVGCLICAATTLNKG